MSRPVLPLGLARALRHLTTLNLSNHLLEHISPVFARWSVPRSTRRGGSTAFSVARLSRSPSQSSSRWWRTCAPPSPGTRRSRSLSRTRHRAWIVRHCGLLIGASFPTLPISSRSLILKPGIETLLLHGLARILQCRINPLYSAVNRVWLGSGSQRRRTSTSTGQASTGSSRTRVSPRTRESSSD